MNVKEHHQSNQQVDLNEAVVLIHGIYMHGFEMALLGRRLKRQGYRVYYFRYRSLRRTPRENAVELHHFVRQINEPVVHYAAHSLGGIVLHHMMAAFISPRPGHCVLLGSPLTGSYVARSLYRLRFVRPFLGRSIHEGLLGGVPVWPGRQKMGMLAGTKPVGFGMLFLAGRLPRPNDGTVLVSETRAEGVDEHVVLADSHFSILVSRQSAQLVLAFLHHGSFAAAADSVVTGS